MTDVSGGQYFFGDEVRDALFQEMESLKRLQGIPQSDDEWVAIIEAVLDRRIQRGLKVTPADLEFLRLRPELRWPVKDSIAPIMNAPYAASTASELGFAILPNSITPPEIATFVSRFAALLPAKTVLDPACGCGTLLYSIRESVHPEHIVGITGEPTFSRIARMLLGDDANTLLDKATDSSIEEARFDLIISDPPHTKWHLSRQGEFPSLRRYPRWKALHKFVVWACEHLTEQGAALIFVDSSFFWDHRAEVIHRQIEASGCCISAAINVPRHHWWKKWPSRESYLLLLRAGKQEQVFIAQYSENLEHQVEIVENLRQRRSTQDPRKGRLCPLFPFRSFDRLMADDRLKRLARKSGFSPVPSDKVFSFYFCKQYLKVREVTIKGSKKYLDKEFIEEHLAKGGSIHDRFLLQEPVDAIVKRGFDRPDAESPGDKEINCYLDPRASLFLGEPPESDRGVFHVSVDTSLAIPEFLVFWFNETQLGRETLRTAMRCDRVSEIVEPITLLEKTILYLPSLEEQLSILNNINTLKRIRSEVDQLESSVKKIEKLAIQPLSSKISRIHRSNQDLYLEWLDTLPFPLASILWHHKTCGEDYRRKYKIMLNFFEATAEFIAIIHLSALSPDSISWAKWGHDLAKKLANSSEDGPLTRAHFGDWRKVIEYCSSLLRKNLSNTDLKQRLQRYYAVHGESMLTTLCDPKLLRVLQEANNIRNDEDAHSGAISDARARSINDKLEKLVEDLRSILGMRWSGYELVQASSGRRTDGNYKSTVRSITGTRAPFLQREISVNDLLEEHHLYLYNAITYDTVKLLPMLKMTLSSEHPANVCYFYNRIYKSGDARARFLSYHYEQKSESIDENSPLPKILNRLFPSASPDGIVD